MKHSTLHQHYIANGVSWRKCATPWSFPSIRNMKYISKLYTQREVKDNRLLVSQQLLIQLCSAALDNFIGYNAWLVRVLFICALAFSMWICEYSSVQVWKKLTNKFDKDHNLRFLAIRVSKKGLTTKFESDKTSKQGDPIKHRTMFWKKLPDFVRSVMYSYRILRKGSHFFSMEDGWPLERNDFLNILEACPLNTLWCHLAVTPHSFRQGRASTKVNEGVLIEEVKHSYRWSQNSKAFDAYCRTDLMMLWTDAMYNAYPKSRKNWSSKRLAFISKHLIQTKGWAPDHLHHVLLAEEFLVQFAEIKDELPDSNPCIRGYCVHEHS